MSFDAFRADLISRLSPKIPADQLDVVLCVMDELSSGWTFETATTAIITSGGVPDAVRLYLASKIVENLAKGTMDNYLYTLRAFFSVVRKNVEDVTSADVRLWLHWYREQHHVSSSTLDHLRIILNSFYEWCVDEDIVRKSPMRHIKPIKCDEPERLPMSALELEKVRKSCETLREKAVVDFLYSTAVRVSELCDMKKSDIDFAEHTVHVRCGKGGKGRTTFLNPEAEISLKAYLASRSDSCDSLFVSCRGEAHGLTKKSVEVQITQIVSRCSLSVHVTPHIFRHTAASIALQRGMPIDQVQKFLGHARIQTTLRYAKTLNTEVKISHQKYVA